VQLYSAEDHMREHELFHPKDPTVQRELPAVTERWREWREAHPGYLFPGIEDQYGWLK